ncbi:TIGR01841 family phasin [Caballeronia cordobensis]|uniref:TIGR01841 family phasin n=1 Tax=Caballeronia cordobensis TaxID=1353886 RepID=UPI00045F031D|nr:phasin [Burkholderia sp. RPE67]
MFLFPPQQIAAFQKAKFQACMSLTDKYMDGFQKLTQLNVQTIRTLISENEGTVKSAPENASDVSEWQSNLLTQLPEKAASYSRHFCAIVSATGEEVVREAQSQFASYGGQVNEIFKTAVENVSEASEKAAAALETNLNQVTAASVKATASAADSLAKENQSNVSAASNDVKGGADTAMQSMNKPNQKH